MRLTMVNILGMIVLGLVLSLFFVLSGCGTGGTDDKTNSDNISYVTNCVQNITIDVNSLEDAQVGDLVIDENGEEGYIKDITKVDENSQGVELTATVCSSEDNDTFSMEGQVDVQASLLPD